jgi:DNA helicase-2/ATP-dependent DNA helicase PcrA
LRPRFPETKDPLQDLNPEQKRAVVHGSGPLLIIAGAGTGKTRVITQRIAYLIASKRARPEEILAVTFTEKAANEMEERVDQLIPYSYSFVEISTFNSFGERILRNYALDLGYPPDFRLLDDVEQAIFFRERLFRLPLEYYRPLSVPTRHIQELLDTIRKLKQEDIRPEEYLLYAAELEKRAADPAGKENAVKHLEIARVYQSYETFLKAEGKIDFEDQVRLVVEMFRRRPSVLAELQGRFKYILVDEFQDTNYIQFELLKLLAASHNNLTVVGDDDQSIFRFRGASLANILTFQKYYEERRVKVQKVVLTRNYRSTQQILDSAYTLIQHNNPFRLEYQSKEDKKLVSSLSDPAKSIQLLQLETVSQEADRVAGLIREKWKTGIRPAEMAVLVRRNADADPFLRALNVNQVPFRFSGSRGLYSQEEVKILASFIRALTDFEDSRSLFFLAHCEVYRMDLYSLTVFSNYAQRKNIPLHGVFREIAQGDPPLEVKPEAVESVKRIYDDLLHFVRLSETKNAGQVVFAFLEKTGYIKGLVETGSLDAELKIKNLRLFFEKIKNFSEVVENDSIQSFAAHLDLLQEVGDNPATAEAELEEEAVNVLTVHKAKGLEFEVVFMVSLIADRFPGREKRERIPFPVEILKERFPSDEDSGSESSDAGALREERRLFYVGMTRAKRELFLTWARDYGLKRLKKVSPFVLEALDIPKPPKEVQRTSALEEISRYGEGTAAGRVAPRLKVKDVLSLSYFQVEDYLVCPLKYQFRHIWRIPVPAHHTLVFGRVLHSVIHSYLTKRKAGEKFGEKELLQEYEKQWINEGFLSREHEKQRKKAGREALRRFLRREEASGRRPTCLEKNFKWQRDGIRFIGRWDRVDIRPEGAVIIDFKATQVKNQKEADKRTADSLQMDLYALSFISTQEGPLLGTQLYFLESDLVGHAAKGQKETERAWKKMREAEEGIRSQKFMARPDYHNCRLCEFKTICPKTYAY